ncbi:nuclear transport factor 2 family protein [Micromonospora radicis]|uniref:Nuclear transport factor 2 family protein n=1 Tax=Micromonospora radicis TaxID=1894971 RepID=A0A418MTX6_9ACTN|nr:nuclear transport factor 2 family protein [Micromonospora radicis]RIV37626.1 nuclear transport factor 2 family protein [Micromonospora radicis]
MDPTRPAGLVDHYLQLCEDRQLEAAGRLLAPGARLVFPGGRRFGSLAEMAAASTGTYRWVRKHRDRYLVGADGDDTTVTSLGRLYGQWPDGSTFDGIRYADVFLLRDGLIVEQHVFNDLAMAVADRPTAIT